MLINPKTGAIGEPIKTGQDHPVVVTEVSMPKSVFLGHQSLVFITFLALASCGVRPDSESPPPAVGNSVVDHTAASTAPTTVVAVNPAPAPLVNTPIGSPTPETPAASVTVNPTPNTATVPETDTAPVAGGTASEIPTTSPVVVPPAATTSWAIVSAQFFTPNCVRCHGAAGGVNLQTYESAKNFLTQIRQVALIDKTMPPRKILPTETTDVLKAWLDAGAPQ
jgi:mono/diheme cytochrome c family protein